MNLMINRCAAMGEKQKNKDICCDVTLTVFGLGIVIFDRYTGISVLNSTLNSSLINSIATMKQNRKLLLVPRLFRQVGSDVSHPSRIMSFAD